MDYLLQTYGRSVIYPVMILAGSLIVGILLRWFARWFLCKIARRSGSRYGEILAQGFAGLLFAGTFLAGINVATNYVQFGRYITPYAKPTLLAIFALILAIITARTLTRIILHKSAESQSSFATTSLTRKVVEIVIYLTAGVTILNIFNVAITPIITALGIGGLALALALQDTLSNFFAGVNITIANQLRVGDFVKIDTFEGTISDIGWRNTAINGGDDNLIIIPNSKLSQATVTNFHLPVQHVRHRFTIAVEASENPQRIQTILQEILRQSALPNVEEAMAEIQPEGKVRGLLLEPEPIVRLISFNSIWLEFSLFYAVADNSLRSLSQHELMMKILEKFRTENVKLAPPPIPFQRP